MYVHTVIYVTVQYERSFMAIICWWPLPVKVQTLKMIKPVGEIANRLLDEAGCQKSLS